VKDTGRHAEEATMASYVFAFRGPSDRTAEPGEEAAWADWFQSIGESISDFGHRVGEVRTVGGDGNGKLTLGGYVLVNADSLSQAAELAEGCPRLKYGAVVEVGETIEM
jgi:hypothetical protein